MSTVSRSAGEHVRENRIYLNPMQEDESMFSVTDSVNADAPTNAPFRWKFLENTPVHAHINNERADSLLAGVCS